MKTYGIIVAMEKEITLLRSKIDDIKVHQLCHLKFYEGIFENNKVIFAIAGNGRNKRESGNRKSKCRNNNYSVD